MRASLKSLLQLLAKRDPADDDFLQDLHKCGWLEHIRKIIKTAADVATLIHQERSSVLVHCSDGWDRTPQARRPPRDRRALSHRGPHRRPAPLPPLPLGWRGV